MIVLEACLCGYHQPKQKTLTVIDKEMNRFEGREIDAALEEIASIVDSCTARGGSGGGSWYVEEEYCLLSTVDAMREPRVISYSIHASIDAEGHEERE